MNRPFKRLLSGAGVLVAVGALALTATTSVFAFHQGFTQSTTTNPGPLNTGIAVAGPSGTNTITPGQSASTTATYSYTAPPSANAGFNAQFATTIGTMYQQWRHNTLTDRWFYLYAGNTNTQGTQAQQSAASVANPTFAYYYYTRERGASAFLPASLAAGVSGGEGSQGVIVSSSAAGATGIIYIDAAGNLPIATVRAMVANVPNCAPAFATTGTGAPAGTRCGATFVTNVRWGLAQEAWPAGSATLLEAVESVPLMATGNPNAGAPATAGTAGSVTYADPWGSNGGATSLVLSDSAPAQGATGVTNVGSVGSPATRFTSTSYAFQQTLTDTNNDILSGSLVFVFSSGSGANSGQWFRVGFVNGDNNDNAISTATPGCEYESWNETVRKSIGCSALSGNYVNSYTAFAAAGSTTGSTAGGATGEVINHTVSFSPTATGTAVVYGRADDFHGLSSGNVQVGAISIAVLPE